MTQSEILKARTKKFAIEIVGLFRLIPKTDEGRVVGKQFLRSRTSVAANYRAVCRARSRPEFISKMGIVLEEIDETVFWLEMLIDCRIIKQHLLEKLLPEANELLAIFAASYNTAKHGRSFKN